jgi:NTP pyrophosphatase (non-canonical NTP hydrolase)
MDTSDYNTAVKTIKEMTARFQKIEGRPWGAEGAIIELTKQVGELSALIMSKEGYYFQNRDKVDVRYKVTDEAIADELFDIFFMTVRLADHYGVNLAEATEKAKNENKAWFESKGLEF